MTNRELADWLTEHMDSHDICDTSVLDGLPTSIRAAIPTHSRTATIQAIQRRGLGGTLAAHPGPFVYGWEVAEAIAKNQLGRNPGDRYNGRGSRFRACVEELRRYHTVTATAGGSRIVRGPGRPQ